jgi:hypothetical protein
MGVGHAVAGFQMMKMMLKKGERQRERIRRIGFSTYKKLLLIFIKEILVLWYLSQFKKGLLQGKVRDGGIFFFS